MQAVILAGGLGTRLYPVTRTIPKSMVPVLGKPFLEWQLDLLREGGVTDIVLCVGHLSEMIRSHFADGNDHGVNIRYSQDGDELLGTAGAVRRALPLLADEFFLTFGDSYLILPYQEIWRDYHERAKAALMVVYRNDNQFDTSDLAVEDGVVQAYQKNPPLPGACFINDGLMIVRRADIAAIPEGQPMALQEFFQPLVAHGELAAWETQQRFYEIGSHAGLEELETLLAGGVVSL